MLNPQNDKIQRPMPKANMWELNKGYALTINPCDRQQGLLGPDNKLEGRFKRMHTYYNKLFNKMDRIGTTLEMYPEISSPIQDTRPRYHFHGTIIFRTPMSLLLWYEYYLPLLRSKSNVDIDTIADPHYWDAYCKKNSDIMKMFSEKMDIRYPTFKTIASEQFKL